jgi:hypothetical protein
MRVSPAFFRGCAANGALALLACGCASEPVKTAGDATRANIGGAVSAPFQDFNLVRNRIPVVLRESVDNPYARPLPDGCETLGVELARLDDALGPDIDGIKAQQSRTDRRLGGIGRVAVAAVKDVTEGWIPMRSWVRYMSGAEAHSSAVQSAIAAGEARRAFLKGIAQSKGCIGIGPKRMTPYPAPPITPSSVAQ